MKIKTFERWMERFAEDVMSGWKSFKFRNLELNLSEDQARELYNSIVSSEPEQPRCKIMRRFGVPIDDTPLGCYVPVAWCDDYRMFEELLEGAKTEHGLICVQEQAEEAIEPAKEPEPEQGPCVLLLLLPGEKPYYRAQFDTRKEAEEWAKQESAFAPPGARRQYNTVTLKEWNEYCAKTAAPSNETPPARDPS